MNKNEKKLLKYIKESVPYNGDFNEIKDKIEIKTFKKKRKYSFIPLFLSLSSSLAFSLIIMFSFNNKNNVTNDTLPNESINQTAEMTPDDGLICLTYNGYEYMQIEILTEDSIKIKDFIEYYQGYEIYMSDNDDEIIVKINDTFILLKKTGS